MIRTKRSQGKTSRRKGHNWERKVANDLHEIDPCAKRNLEYQEGAGYDINTSIPLCIQCKCGKNIPWVKGFEEAQAAAGVNKIPILAAKIDNVGEFAVMSWDQLLVFLKLWKRNSYLNV